MLPRRGTVQEILKEALRLPICSFGVFCGFTLPQRGRLFHPLALTYLDVYFPLPWPASRHEEADLGAFSISYPTC